MVHSKPFSRRERPNAARGAGLPSASTSRDGGRFAAARRTRRRRARANGPACDSPFFRPPVVSKELVARRNVGPPLE
jgi:hypothetical protein